MPIYVDLQPAPQFDESLVRYCAINFNRIRELFMYARKRIQVDNISGPGPWAQIVQVNVPYRADVVIWGSIGFWATALVGLVGIRMTWDGVFLPNRWEMYFNEVGSGKVLQTANVVRNVTKGTHQTSQAYITGYEASDTNSRLRLAVTYYEL